VWKQLILTVVTVLTLLLACDRVASADSTSPFTAAGPATTASVGTEGQPGDSVVQGTGLEEQRQAASSAVDEAANQQLESLPTQSLEQFWQRLQQDYGGYLPNVSGNSLIHAVMASGGFNVNGLVHGLLSYFLREVFDNAELLGGILLLSVLAAMLESLQSAFERQTVSEVAYAMIFLVLLVMAIGSFTEAVGYARHAIQSMNDFMLATVPLVVALLAASGALASAAFFQPVLLFSVHLISNVVFLVVFPLIFFAAVLDIVSALSPRYKLTRLAGLLRTVGVAALGLALSAFIGVTSVQGLGKGIADGVALRTAKFTVSTFVPVIGKAVADAAETVASASLLVKNAVGIAGLVVIACIALFPALKILALSFIYNGSSALMQPLGDTPMVACLGALGKSLILVFASVAAVALMFFLTICILLVSANLAVVMG
jgi:stage III sporulation protein AE